MLRLQVPALLGLLVLNACASDTDLLAGELPSGKEGKSDGELTFAENPLAGDVVAPDGEVQHEAPLASDSTQGELDAERESSFVEDAEAVFQRLAATPLADGERLELEHIFSQAGIQPSDVKLVGSLVLDHDVYTVAEDILALSDELVAKGRVLSDTFPTKNGTPGGLESAASTIYARMSGSNFQFFRPYVSDKIGYIVPANDFLLTLMTSIVRSVNDTASDCLVNGASGTLRAGTEANYAALDANAKKRMTKVTITIGPLNTVCPGAQAGTVGGCSLAPRKIDILHADGVTRSTMSAGGRIGLVNTIVTGTDSLSRRIATHELGHTLGLAHPFLTGDADSDGLPDAILVPGTSTNTNVLSVMQNGCIPVTTNCNVPDPRPTCCNIAATNLSTEDTDMIDTLYSAQAGGSCAYVNDFQTVVAN